MFKVDRLSKVLRAPISTHRLYQHDVSSKTDKLKAFKDLSHRVNSGRECWAWQIQSAAFSLRGGTEAEGRGWVTATGARDLMRACQTDIVDLYPGDQRLLTEIAWDCIQEAEVAGGLNTDIYNNMVLAFINQEVNLDVPNILEEMRTRKLEPDTITRNRIVDYYCKSDKVDSALKFIGESDLSLSEHLAWSLIFGQAARGQVSKAEEILKTLNEKNIHWNLGMYKAFILGSAKFGDADATQFFLSKYRNNLDTVILEAVQLMNKNHPDKLSFLLDKLPVNVEMFSARCRRTVKMLLETGNTEAAWRLVRMTREVGENNSDKDRVIKISPSVIALRHFILNCEKQDLILAKIRELVTSDKRIVARAVLVLIETAFERPEKSEVARKVIRELLENSDQQERQLISNYVGQSSKRRLTEASLVSRDQLVSVFQGYCALGLSIDKVRAWDILMKTLIPDIPDHGTWSQRELIEKSFRVKDLVTNSCHGVYSHSVVWSHILQHLINRENPLFFKTAATVCKKLKVAYGPQRWYLSLANCLVVTRDVASFVDILEVCYHNCEKKNRWDDYDVLCSSMYAAIAKGQNRNVDVDVLLGDILDEFWKRNLRIPAHFRESIMGKLHDKKLRLLFENVPVLGKHVFKRNTRKASKAKDVKILDDGINCCAQDIVKKISDGELDMTKLFIKTEVHPQKSDASGIDWVFFADTLNFSFWMPEDGPQYLVTYSGTTYTGYLAMCAAINRALDSGVRITDPKYFVDVDEKTLGELLGGDDGVPIPLLSQRVECLHQVGRVLLDKFSGTFNTCLAQCGNSAAKLLKMVLDNFPCFNDSSDFEDTRVSFHKRAQILVADIWCLFEGTGVGSFRDIDTLTMFADYRVPQSLQHYGALQYSADLLQWLAEDKMLQSGDKWEAEIRGCSIEAVERITRRVREQLEVRGVTGARVNSILVDQYLWGYRREHAETMRSIPYHKVRSIFY